MRWAELGLGLVLTSAACGRTDTTQQEKTPASAPGVAAAESEHGASVEDDAWSRLDRQRRSHLAVLAEPIVACVAQSDTEHPIFHGCYDWHSAVHGVWALYRLGGASKEDDAGKWLSNADAVLDAAALSALAKALSSGALDNEKPYGFAWFLLLAQEREVVTANTGLRELGREVAAQLRRHIDELSPAQREQGIWADDYKNLAWAYLNLWRWSALVGDDQAKAWAEQAVARELLVSDERCSLAEEGTRVANFFSPCMMRAHALVEVLGRERAGPWIRAFVGAADGLTPLTAAQIDRPHPGGLNFSRAWGLWSIWEASGDERWRSSYAEHIEMHIAMKQYWGEDYASFSHWVPQFGIYAISLSEGPS